MKRLFPYLLGCVFALVLLTLASIGCDDSNSDHSDSRVSGELSIYLLDDVYADVTQLENRDLSQLELQDEPWLSIDDIDFYDLSTHCIYLKEDWPSLGVDTRMSFTIPFVVVANGERCYLGYFNSPVSSWLPRTPVIYSFPDFGLYPKDVIYISNRSIDSSSVDLRNDERIRNALLQSNKLCLGVRVELNDVEFISQSETATLSYTFTVTNDSDDTLYVPDPDKMGSGLFHYYTNGVLLYKPDGSHFWSEHKTTNPPETHDGWDVKWFTRLGSDKSMKRTVILNGYPDIPKGTYSCYFTYSGPNHIEKSKRMLSDGRLWIGEVLSSTIESSIGN
jgi:hypothetical protein